MSQMRLLYYEHYEEENVLEAIYIKCSNFHISTGLRLKDKKVEETITQFVLNLVLHHVGLSWIISSNKQMIYETKENNPGWLN